MHLPICPCWCCIYMRKYCCYALFDPVPGEDVITFPSEGTGIMPSPPFLIGATTGLHGLPIEAHHLD